MVRIAIAGGSGNVGSEIIDVLVAAEKHEIVLLSRKETPAHSVHERVTWLQVDYRDEGQLIHALQGVHTLLSFIAEQDDPTSPLQKLLIEAALQAGVKRFAPSEWGPSGLDQISWYSYKGEIRRYLQNINKSSKVLEYTLFQPGLFMNYLTSPRKSAKHVAQTETPFDLNKGRMIILDGSEDDRITFTTVQDLAEVVVRAVDFEGEWPVNGGVTGTQLSIKQLIALGEKVRGVIFKVEKIPVNELDSGAWKTSWSPKLDHPSIPTQKDDQLARYMVASILKAVSAGAYICSDAWNQLLPDFAFTDAESFLADAWADEP